MASVASFQARFPEFANTDSDLIESVLSEATLELQSDVWGDRLGEAILYLAAHKLAISPFGEPARLSDSSKDDIYMKAFKRLRSRAILGLRNA